MHPIHILRFSIKNTGFPAFPESHLMVLFITKAESPTFKAGGSAMILISFAAGIGFGAFLGMVVMSMLVASVEARDKEASLEEGLCRAKSTVGQNGLRLGHPSSRLPSFQRNTGGIDCVLTRCE
jgi:hypothetical protein